MPKATNDPATAAPGFQLADLLEADAEALVAHGLEPATMQAAFSVARDRLAQGNGPDQLVALTEQAARLVEDLWAEFEPESPSYDCHKGCSWCCHQNVMVTLPEILRVARHVEETFSQAEKAALAERTAARAREIAGLTTAERFDRRLACVFLVEGICSVHAARPLQCRGGFSESAEFCRRLLEDRAATEAALERANADPPFLTVPKTLFDSGQAGIAGALQRFGLDAVPLELTAGYAIMLQSSSAVDRWRGGACDIFAAAQLRRKERSFCVGAGPAGNV